MPSPNEKYVLGVAEDGSLVMASKPDPLLWWEKHPYWNKNGGDGYYDIRALLAEARRRAIDECDLEIQETFRSWTTDGLEDTAKAHAVLLTALDSLYSLDKTYDK